MQKSVRQSMAWLHSWVGLLLGWLMFCIFLTGATTYYRQEINLWSQPTLTTIHVNQQRSIDQAFHYLNAHAPNAQNWFIQVANHDSPISKLYWQKPDGLYESINLNPNTGKPITLAGLAAGEFFYNFHFQLYAIPYWLGRLIVSFAAFIMLITLISGIITHKKIFTDFFTLRTFKGQRSYLDVHNVTAVIALPFFLTVTFTGLAIFFYLYFPLGINHIYPNNTFQYFDEINTTPLITAQPNSLEPSVNLKQIQNIVSQHMKDITYNTITVKHPNTAKAFYIFTALEDLSITRNAAQISLNAQGEIQANTKNYSPVATLNAGVYGLHMAKFAQPILRLTLYFSGLLGCCMIASGLLLWSLKRQLKHHHDKYHFGLYIVDRLNISILIGLPIAMFCYFVSNRISLILSTVTDEISTFFSVWVLCLIFSLFIPKQYLWKSFLSIFILCGIAVLLLDLYYIFYTLTLDAAIPPILTYWKFIRFDLFIVCFVIFAILLHRKIEPIKAKMSKKMKIKINQTIHPQEAEK